MQALLSLLQQTKYASRTAPFAIMLPMNRLHFCMPQGLLMSPMLTDLGQQEWGLSLLSAHYQA